MTTFTRQNPPPGFYTYAYLREDGRPYYIGKGGGTNPGRAWQRHGSAKKPWRPPCDERILFLKWDMTEEEALAHEIYLIAVYGNAKIGGWLKLNFTDGGEGTSGYVYTDELRETRRNQLTGNTYGANVVWDDEKRAKLSAATTGKKKTITPALEARHDALNLRNHWRHPKHGDRFASAQEMHHETGHHQSNFWHVRQGNQSQTHGWTCLDPVKVYKPKQKDITAAVAKAAETKNKQGAEELGVTLDEYMAMSYDQRFRARKKKRAAQAA